MNEKLQKSDEAVEEECKEVKACSMKEVHTISNSENFLEKTGKLYQFSNSRQIRVKSVFANFKHNNGPNRL